MIINHNMNAMNAHRNMGMNNVAAGKSMEKLSSGLRINRAGDDAAGLAISEKMRGQIRGLDQASRNSQDGISMIQTAEGALNETQNIIQRMRELSVQAANDTNTADDRTQIQEEINQLTKEVDRIANNTEFNTQKLLNGNKHGEASDAVKGDYSATVDFTKAIEIDGKSFTAANMDTLLTQLKNDKDLSSKYDFSQSSGTTLSLVQKEGVESANAPEIKQMASEVTANKTSVVAGKDATKAVYETNIDFTEFTAGASININGTGVITFTDLDDLNAKLDAKGFVASVDENDKLVLTAKEAGEASALNSLVATTNGTDAVTGTPSLALKSETGTASVKASCETDVAIADLSNGDKLTIGEKSFEFGKDFTDIASLNVVLEKSGLDIIASQENANLKLEAKQSGAGNIPTVKFTDATDVAVTTNTAGKEKVEGKVSLQVGANKGQNIELEIGDMRAEALNITANGEALDVSNHENANIAIKAFDSALNKVSGERAKLGAVQNRLEYTTKNLDNTSENLQAAESRIRDVDMAKEMLNFSKNNILQQAAQSMLGQAKSQPEGVLQLLR